ncbi:MAG TPA: hypothetical protein VK563_20415 [Puia sp.]|nr:hypothetical protein [Puia sp.]
MNREFTFFIPGNIDLDAVLAANPTTQLPILKREKLAAVLHIVSDIASINKDISYNRGYIPINAEVLRSIIGKEYHYYLLYLVEVGILDCNYSFSRRFNISTGYKFKPAYQTELKAVTINVSKPLHGHLVNSASDTPSSTTSNTSLTVVIEGTQYAVTTSDMTPTVTQELVKSKLPCKAKSLTKEEIKVFNFMMRSKYAHAYKWLDRMGLKIDHESAHSYNAKVYNVKRANPDLRDREYSTRYKRIIVKDPYIQYLAGHSSIENIRNGRVRQHFDPNICRFHTNLTNMKRELRNFITWDSQPLVGVDLSSSQPTLLTGLFDPLFWRGEKEFSISSLPLSINPSFVRTSPLITLCDFIHGKNGAVPEDVNRYISLIEGGNFKDNFRDLVFKSTGRHYLGDSIKPVIFLTLYTSNRFIGQPEAEPKRAFRDVFPNVYKLTCLLKKGQSEALPKLLQRMESYLMFNKILPRIEYERPDLPLFAIHDSLVTIRGNEEYVEQIMKQEIHKAIGIQPHFKRECWHPNQLDHIL